MREMTDARSSRDYFTAIAFSTRLLDREITVLSKPGFPDWDRVTPATTLLADVVAGPQSASILVLGCGNGALAAALGQKFSNGHVSAADVNSVALSMTRRTIEANGVGNVRVIPEPIDTTRYNERFDVVVMAIPNDRKLTRRWLVQSFGILKEGGCLYVSGSNDHGIRSVIGDAHALFANATLLEYRARNRVARAGKTPRTGAEPSWASEPGIAPGTWFRLEVETRGVGLQLRTLPGVFSYDHLDAGTDLLLRTIAVPPGARVLDVGCGSGIIGLVAAKLGAGNVDMVDANLLAVAAAAENVTHNRVTNARVFPSDVMSGVSGARYDLILANPPFHIGKDVDYDVANALLTGSIHGLHEGGRVVVVANKFIRYGRKMQLTFGNVETVAETHRYHVLASERIVNSARGENDGNRSRDSHPG